MIFEKVLLFLAYTPMCVMVLLLDQENGRNGNEVTAWKKDNKKSVVASTTFPEYLLYDRHMMDLKTLFEFIEKSKTKRKASKEMISNEMQRGHNSKRQAVINTSILMSKEGNRPACTRNSIAKHWLEMIDKMNRGGYRQSNCEQTRFILSETCSRYGRDNTDPVIWSTCPLNIPATQQIISAEVIINIKCKRQIQFTATLKASLNVSNNDNFTSSEVIELGNEENYCYTKSITGWLKDKLNGHNQSSSILTIDFELRCNREPTFNCLQTALNKPFLVINFKKPTPENRSRCSHDFSFNHK